MKYRHLNRTSAHRQALLRNLVEALIEHESIKTTWPKAKEAQRLADKMITWGKKNTNASRKQATAVFYVSRYLFRSFNSTRARVLSLHLSPSLGPFAGSTGESDTLTNTILLSSDHYYSYPKYLVSCENATQTDLVATPVFSAWSPTRKINHHRRSWNW